MSAVNDGNVFRMLSKPCPPERLIKSLYSGLRQHELIVGEKVLLEQTLKGAVAALSQALATAKPLFFGRAQRVRRLAGELADRLEEPNKWRIEVASIFSQIASITLPEAISEDVYHKRELSKEIQEIVGRFPEVTEQMLEKIPRLEEVREIITKIDLQPRFELADEKVFGEPLRSLRLHWTLIITRSWVMRKLLWCEPCVVVKSTTIQKLLKLCSISTPSRIKNIVSKKCC
jgi:hypothetical protein